MSEEAAELRFYLREAVRNDTNYEERYYSVIHAMSHATAIGYKVGIRIDPNEPEWPVVYIELPTGQVSWYMPQHEKEYDGHSTEEKFERIKRFIES
jgi:hypothetical protein